MSELNVWLDSAYHPHGAGGIPDAGNWFLYDDCCVWARATQGLADRLVHDTLEKRVAAGEEQVKLSPQDLASSDKHNWLLQRSEIRHGYMYAGKEISNAGDSMLSHDVYYNAVVLELTDGSRKHLEWRYDSAKDRDDAWPGSVQRWLADLFVDGPPPRATPGQTVRRLLRRS